MLAALLEAEAFEFFHHLQSNPIEQSAGSIVAQAQSVLERLLDTKEDCWLSVMQMSDMRTIVKVIRTC